MSLNRYSTELAQSFFLPLEQPGPWLRAIAPWFVLALAAHFAVGLGLPGGGLIPFGLNGLAFGAFAVTWQRFVALGEEPGRPVAIRIGLRHLLWALAYQLLLGFESFPILLLSSSLADMESGKIIGIAVQEAFQLLVGIMFLILPHIALYQRGEGKSGASLQEMTLAGGISVGFGYVLSNLPFLVISLAWADLVGQLPAGQGTEIAAGLVQFVLSFAALTVSSAYFAKVWLRLRVEAPRLGRPAPETDDTEGQPDKPRRTERLQKRKR